MIDNPSKILKSQVKRFDTLNIFKEINLADILDSNELEIFLKESLPGYHQNDDHSDDEMPKKRRSLKKPTNVLFDRVSLIIKFLSLSIDKLLTYQETSLVKGLEWYIIYNY